MQITTRKFESADLPACLAVEAATMGSNRYLGDSIDFFRQTRGELTVGLADGTVAGIGKLTLLFDGSAWLETLRVHPDFQRRGVGAAIYVKYMQQLIEHDCPSVRMYTGVKNVASAALAENNGLRRAQEFRGMTLDLATASERECPKMSLATNDEAGAIIEPLREQTGGYLNINHTFYAMNAATYSGFASNGWVFDGGDCSLVAGARFQPKKALYIAAIGGDWQKSLDFAIMQAKARGVEKIVAHFAPQHANLQAFYEKNGFIQDLSDDVVMENILHKN